MKVYGAVLIGGVCLIVAAILHGVLSRPVQTDQDTGDRFYVKGWTAEIRTSDTETYRAGDSLAGRYEIIDAEGVLIVRPVGGKGELIILPKDRLLGLSAVPATDPE